MAEGARVKAKVTASTITIAGELDGEVLCHGVFQIMPSGQVSASVSARRLIVQEGGLYNGEFRMITDSTRPGTSQSDANAGANRGEAATSSPLDALSIGRVVAKADGRAIEPEPGDDGARRPRRRRMAKEAEPSRNQVSRQTAGCFWWRETWLQLGPNSLYFRAFLPLQPAGQPAIADLLVQVQDRRSSRCRCACALPCSPVLSAPAEKPA